MKNHKKKKNRNKFAKNLLKNIFDTGVFLLIVLVATLLLSKYVVERIVVHNISMEATILPEDNILIDKLSYRFREPKRFDIIVFKQNNSKEELIKRIIGLPGETIQIIDGNFVIDGEIIKDIEGLDSPYYEGIASSPIRLLEGEYFVVGDNRRDSIDSRYEEIGLVPSTKIVGRMFMRLLPLNRFKIF